MCVYSYNYIFAWHKIKGELEAECYSDAVAKVIAIKDKHFKLFGMSNKNDDVVNVKQKDKK